MVIAAAEKAMGWGRVEMPSFSPGAVAVRWQRGPHDYPLIWWNDTLHINQLEGWNPLESDSDAFMLVDALKRDRKAAFVLGSNGFSHQHSAWFFNDVWALRRQQNAVPERGDPHLYGAATDSSRRRAIVTAALRAAGHTQ